MCYIHNENCKKKKVFSLNILGPFLIIWFDKEDGVRHNLRTAAEENGLEISVGWSSLS